MRNQLINPAAETLINQMKEEIAQEFGIQYGADISSRDNGRIGGEITKRLIQLGEQKLIEMSQEHSVNHTMINQSVNNQSQLH